MRKFDEYITESILEKVQSDPCTLRRLAQSHCQRNLESMGNLADFPASIERENLDDFPVKESHFLSALGAQRDLLDSYLLK